MYLISLNLPTDNKGEKGENKTGEYISQYTVCSTVLFIFLNSEH